MNRSQTVSTLAAALALGALLTPHEGSPLLAAAAPAAAPAFDRAAWERDLEAWKARRLERLKAPDSWLTVVGLLWLAEGDNRFGSRAENEAVLAGAPPLVGTFAVRGNSVEFAAAPAVEVTTMGQRLERSAVATDASGAPTMLATGSFTFFVIERRGRFALRVRDSEAQKRREFAGLDYFPADPAYRVEARLEPSPAGTKVPIPNVLGGSDETPSPGKVVFRLGDVEYRLTAIAEGDSPELFLVFGDQTSGKETYGGGRFVYAPKPDAEGRTIVDFNRAYNPPCAFTAFATCPLPPRENRLPLAVRAGEKKHGSGHP